MDYELDIFDITGEDISKLADGDLRTLVGLLCEAEFRSSEQSVKGIHWGGDQDAPDGGADVLIDSDQNPLSDYIPSKFTVFQIKKPAMPPSAIKKEMRPKGDLKPVIKDAILNKGSYIIISSSDNTSYSAWQSRVEKMKELVVEEDGAELLFLDFYDSNRLATWVRGFESLVIWIRNRVGRPIQGWRPFDNWSYMSGNNEYLLDDQVKLQTGNNESDHLNALEGIHKIRKELSQEKASIRLTGLSGVGKTRFVQALFEESIGEGALDKTRVIYTDMSLAPSPAPVLVAESLILSDSNSILVIDNCLPELHNQLNQICKRGSSKLSLLTVEYDVRDDLPDETNVYVLKPSSEDLIEKLLEKRFAYIQPGIARQIARFSGGNARLSIVLANTFQKGNSVSELRDEQLFERLFYQRKDKIDQDLQTVAQVCSLVYSFDGEETGDNSELRILSKLCNLDVITVYKRVSELISRDLVQTRSKWRAVLPHALANKLAKQALDFLPIDLVNSTFIDSGNERLLRSFSRRLGYLHDSVPALNIVSRWLDRDGWLGDLARHNSFQFEVFQNIAPVNQQKTLEVFERMANQSLCSKDNNHFEEHFELLRLLAYEERLFVRSCKLLCSMILIDYKPLHGNRLEDDVKRLFKAYLSGTMAVPETRLEVIDHLLKSEIAENEVLGIQLLGSTLDTGHFWGAGSNEFGSRPRGYGYYLKTYGETKKWYLTFINYIFHYPNEKLEIRDKLKKVFGEKLTGLLAYSSLYEEILYLIRESFIDEFWFEGWIAINRVLDIYSQELSQEQKDCFREIRNQIGPRTLMDRIEIFVLSSGYISSEDLFDLEEGAKATDKSELLADQAELCGEEAVESTEFQNILEKCISNEGRGLFSFGMGLFRGAKSKPEIWTQLKNIGTKLPDIHTSFRVLQGFLKEGTEHDRSFVDDCLNDLLLEESLCRFFVSAECTVGVSTSSEDRLLRAIGSTFVPVDTFKFIGWGKYHEGFNDHTLKNILERILMREGGDGVCADILHMRLFGENNPSNHIQEMGKKVLLTLSQYSIEDNDSRLDFSLSEIIKKCALDSETIEILSRREQESVSGYRLRHENSDYLLSLRESDPIAFLNGFLLKQEGSLKDERITRIVFSNSKNPIEDIDESILVKWIMVSPEKRFPIIIYLLKGFRTNEHREFDWINIVYKALEQTYDLGKTLDAVEYSTLNHNVLSSGGSYYPRKIELAERLINHKNEQVKKWAVDFKKRMVEGYEQEKLRQEDYSKRENESFE